MSLCTYICCDVSFTIDMEHAIFVDRSFNYEVYLKDIFKYRTATAELDVSPFENSDFKSLDLRTKVEVLHRLCDYRLDAEDVMDQLKVRGKILFFRSCNYFIIFSMHHA